MGGRRNEALGIAGGLGNRGGTAGVRRWGGRRHAAPVGVKTLAAHLRAADILRQDLEKQAEAAVLRRLFWQKAWHRGTLGRK